MVELVIRAVEAPVSLSFAVARKGAALAGRMTGWALTGILGGVLPGSDGSGKEIHDTEAETAPTATQEAAPEPAAMREAGPTPVAAVGPEPPATSTDDLSAQASSTTVAEPPVAAPGTPSTTTPEEDKGAITPEAKGATTPKDKGAATDKRAATVPSITHPGPAPAGPESTHAGPAPAGPESTRVDEGDAAPLGGEDGAIVEHEPGLGTSVRARSPHSALNNPATEPDMTEWPDPYDKREDPRDPGEEMVFGGETGHTQTGATSTSEPHPSQDPQAEPWEGPKRDKVDQ
jgi:hypothetical protein